MTTSCQETYFAAALLPEQASDMASTTSLIGTERSLETQESFHLANWPTTQSSESEREAKMSQSVMEDAIQRVKNHFNATDDDILEASQLASTLTPEEVCKFMKHIVRVHRGDQNFPFETLRDIEDFLAQVSGTEKASADPSLVASMRLATALIQTNSPYTEVRGVVSNTDDPSMPVSTIRAWVLAIFFSVLLSFVNQLFSIRQPPISINNTVAQLLAYPLGKAWERWMPKWEVEIPLPMMGRADDSSSGEERQGKETGKKRKTWKLELNPGPFNKKEHMVVSIAATTAQNLPYTDSLIFVQVLPSFFNQPYAHNFGYMFLNAFAANFIGYGLAGLTRKFLVYPSYCLWQGALVVISLNNALHQHSDDGPVQGPFRTTWRASRYGFFLVTFAAMFVYFWFPNYLFSVLSFFNWMTWPAPGNAQLTALTGMVTGLGLLNPVPTFDWNFFSSLVDPLVVPSFTTFNFVMGTWLSGWIAYALWASNTWNFGYLPINSPKVFNSFGLPYNLSMILDDNDMFDPTKYEKYSPVYVTSGFAIMTVGYFAMYTGVLTHVVLHHRTALVLACREVFSTLPFKWARSSKVGRDADGAGYRDGHTRLMESYPEVPEWWFLTILLTALIAGIVAVSCWPTNTSPAVVLYGVALCLFFMIPIGLVTSMTGLEVTIQGLAEYLGGVINEGNAIGMNYFKVYGHTALVQAIAFAADLKLAHYLKVPPRVTFSVQMLSTLISTLVSTAVLWYQVKMDGVCGPDAPMRFTCPGPNTFFTTSILWGTIGPARVFGATGQYTWMLAGFPLGIVIVLIPWLLTKKFPRNKGLRQVHAVVAIGGATVWGNYNFSYVWPCVPVAWFSWIYVRRRFLIFWSRYNYVLSASFSTAIALSGLIMLFSVEWANVSIDWWGNTRPFHGCELEACPLETLAPREEFYPWWKG